jgi:tetratricopeptide (TPR) repeat protein
MKLSALAVAALLIAGPVAMTGQEMESALQSLKDAQSKKDVASVKKLALETCALARKAAAEPAPAGEAEKKEWTARVEYVHSVQEQAEYVLLTTAMAAEPAEAVDLMSVLEQENPKSKYLNEGGYATYFAALAKSGGSAKAAAIADKALANFPSNETLLTVAADSALAKKQNARAGQLADRLIASKPKSSAVLGRAYWISGVVAADTGHFFNADKSLRAALPLIKDNQAMMGAALFSLGVANYQLGRQTNNKAKVLEAVKFSEQCAAIPGPMAEQASRNAQVMRTDAGKMR